MTDKIKPLNEGVVRRSIKDGVSKPTKQEYRPTAPPPAPKPKTDQKK